MSLTNSVHNFTSFFENHFNIILTPRALLFILRLFSNVVSTTYVSHISSNETMIMNGTQVRTTKEAVMTSLKVSLLSRIWLERLRKLAKNLMIPDAPYEIRSGLYSSGSGLKQCLSGKLRCSCEWRGGRTHELHRQRHHYSNQRQVSPLYFNCTRAIS